MSARVKKLIAEIQAKEGPMSRQDARTKKGAFRVSRGARKGALGVPIARWLRALPPWKMDYSDSTPNERAYERLQDRHAWRAASGWLAEDLGISRRALLAATKGLPFRRDFGHIVAFHEAGLRNWAVSGFRAKLKVA